MSKATQTCLTCQNYNRCKNPDKSFGFKCLDYTKIDGANTSKLLDMIAQDTFDEHERTLTLHNDEVMSEKEANVKESQLISYLDDFLDNPNPLPRDLKFNDSDLVEFKNFFHWNIDPKGSKTRPFARQLAIGVLLFAEYCPRCSHPKMGNIYTIPYRASLEKVAENVTFLEYGVCPRCGARKSELIKTGELALFDEFAGCLAADTLVSTERGLLRIGDMSKGSKGLSIYTGNSNRKIENWFNKGVKKTYKLRSNKGYMVDATADHEIQVFDSIEGLVWKRLDKVSKSDYLTIGTTGTGTRKKLKLDIEPVEVREYSNRGFAASFPKYMNPKLAKILGYLISEGTITKSGSYFINTNMQLHSDITACIKDQFSVDTKLTISRTAGDFGGFIGDRRIVSTQNCYTTCLYNKQVNHWLHSLGLGVTAYDKFIPDVILQADVESVKAFIAAYIDGDGSIRKDRINIWSRSNTILSQFQSLLASIGVVSNISQEYCLEVNDVFGEKLYSYIEPYLIQKKGLYETKRRKQHSTFGIPRSYIYTFLNSRRSPNYSKKFPIYLTDNGDEVLVKGFRKFSCLSDSVYGKYVCYDDPKFEAELLLLKQISKSFYKDLCRLKNNRFYFDSVASRRYSGTKRVYDLEVAKDHYLTANGVVVHNCIGQRGGKSAMFSLLAPYVTHKYLKMQNPNRLFGQMEHTVLSGTFVGLTFARAMSLLWAPILNLMRTSEWFQEYHALMDIYAEKYGVTPYVIKDTFVEYRHRRLRLYPSGPNKRTLRGDCVVGSTVINTNAGFLHFDELVSRKGFNEVDNVKISSPTGVKKVSHTLKTRRSTLKVVTRNGYEIEGTPEHPMYVLQPDLTFAWKRLDTLEVGDFILSKSSTSKPIFGKNKIDLNLATVAGYMVANGYRSEVSSDDPKVIKRLRKCATALGGGVTSTTGVPGIRAATHYLTYAGRGRSGTFKSELLDPIGYTAQSSYDKEIPIGIRMASKEVLHEFLEAYFECDSHVNGGNSHKGGKGLEVELSSASEKLIHQLHVILLNVYGIVARRSSITSCISSRLRNGDDTPATYHILTLTGFDASLFLKAFKRAKVHQYKDRFSHTRSGVGSDRRVIPYVRKVLWEMYEAARLVDGSGKKLRRLVLANGDTVLNDVKPVMIDTRRLTKDTVNGSLSRCPEILFYGMTKEQIKRIKQIDPDTHKRVAALLKLDGHYEEVISVEEGSKVWVYDVTVPDGHAFMANGLVSHNTRYISGIDEAGWFYSGDDDDEERERASGKEVHGALDRSLKTIRIASRNKILSGYDNLISGYNISISSPSHEKDLIMYLTTLYKDSRECLAVRLPTWKFNPQYKSRDDFKKEYAENYARAERDFGVNPQVNENKAFTQDEVILMSQRFTRTNRVTISTQSYTQDNEAYTSPIVTSMTANELPSVLSIDAGEVNNSFSLTLLQRENEKSSPQVAALIEIVPIEGTRINFNQVYTKLMVPIFNKFHVVGVVADRWQSTAILNRCTDEFGIHVKRISAKAAHFTNFSSYHLPDMLVHYPKPEIALDKIFMPDNEDYRVKFKQKPVAHFLHQLNTIQNLDGVYEKGKGNTDDLVRSTVVGMALITDPSFVEKYLKAKTVVSPSAIGISSLGSIGGYPSVGTGMAGASSVGASSLNQPSGSSGIASPVVSGAVMSRRR